MSETTTTTADTTTLRMSSQAYDLLVGQHGWADPGNDGTLTAVPQGDRMLVTIKTRACQSIDLFEAAVHCVHTLAGWTAEKIEVVTHDGSLS